MAEYFLDRHEAGSAHHELRSTRVTKIVKAEWPIDAGSLECRLPRLLQITDGLPLLCSFKVTEDVFILPGFVSNSAEDVQSRIGHWDSDGLLGLGFGDPDNASVEVALIPTETEDVSFPQRGISSQLDDWAYMPALVVSGFEQGRIFVIAQIANEFIVGLEKLRNDSKLTSQIRCDGVIPFG